MMRATTRPQPTTEREQLFWERGVLVAGIDEAGRGCLAGPVVAAAVVLPCDGGAIAGLNDSKVLSAAKREALFEHIVSACVSYGVGIRDARAIEQYNILQSTMHAMHEAIDALSPVPAHLFVDGNYFRGHSLPFTTVVDGDALCMSIAAASIIAKVTRDRWMTAVADVLYPVYGFARHKGYATAEHRRALALHGPCDLHRQTFLSNPELFPARLANGE